MIPVSNWTGFYIGINGGYSWGKAGRELTFFNPQRASRSFRLSAAAGQAIPT